MGLGVMTVSLALRPERSRGKGTIALHRHHRLRRLPVRRIRRQHDRKLQRVRVCRKLTGGEAALHLVVGEVLERLVAHENFIQQAAQREDLGAED